MRLKVFGCILVKKMISIIEMAFYATNRAR